jgi:hypothetical protein
MKEIKNSKLIIAKGFLFLLLGTLAGALIVLETGSVKISLLLAITIWAFCRCYYFAFYVIEKYVDAKFRFTGLINFLAYLKNKGARP